MKNQLLAIVTLTALFLISGCRNNPADESTTGDATKENNSEEVVTGKEPSSTKRHEYTFWKESRDSMDIKCFVIPHSSNKEEILEMDKLLKACLGKTPEEMDLFENKMVKERMMELMGEQNYKFIIDTCYIRREVEFYENYFTCVGNAHHQEDELVSWVLYSPEEDNMIAILWRYPATKIYCNKEKEGHSAIMRILDGIESMEEENKELNM